MMEELLFSRLKYDNLTDATTIEYQMAKQLDDLRKSFEAQAEKARELNLKFVGMLQRKKEFDVLGDDEFYNLIKEIEEFKNND